MVCMAVGRLDFAGGAVCYGVLVLLLCFATRDVHVVRLVFLLSQDHRLATGSTCMHVLIRRYHVTSPLIQIYSFNMSRLHYTEPQFTISI